MHGFAKQAVGGVSPPPLLPSLGRHDFAAYARVLREGWVYHVVAFLGFGTTLVVYPAVAVLAEPTSEYLYVPYIDCTLNGSIFHFPLLSVSPKVDARNTNLVPAIYLHFSSPFY